MSIVPYLGTGFVLCTIEENEGFALREKKERQTGLEPATLSLGS